MRQSKNRVLFKDGQPIAWVAICKKVDPSEADRWVVMNLLANPFADQSKARRRVYGEVDLENFVQAQSATEQPSFYTCAVEKIDSKVKITLQHSCVERWNIVWEVDFTWDWQDQFLAKHREFCRSNYRETHIANLRDLTL